jgi:hypothetical protein
MAQPNTDWFATQPPVLKNNMFSHLNQFKVDIFVSCCQKQPFVIYSKIL